MRWRKSGSEVIRPKIVPIQHPKEITKNQPGLDGLIIVDPGRATLPSRLTSTKSPTLSSTAIGLAAGFAQELSEILPALSLNSTLNDAVQALIARQPMRARRRRAATAWRTSGRSSTNWRGERSASTVHPRPAPANDLPGWRRPRLLQAARQAGCTAPHPPPAVRCRASR